MCGCAAAAAACLLGAGGAIALFPLVVVAGVQVVLLRKRALIICSVRYELIMDFAAGRNRVRIIAVGGDCIDPPRCADAPKL